MQGETDETRTDVQNQSDDQTEQPSVAAEQTDVQAEPGEATPEPEEQESASAEPLVAEPAPAAAPVIGETHVTWTKKGRPRATARLGAPGFVLHASRWCPNVSNRRRHDRPSHVVASARTGKSRRRRKRQINSTFASFTPTPAGAVVN